MADEAFGEDTPQFFRHVKREKWGLAQISWERGDKRGYQFDDGQLRVIKKGYYGLLKPVEKSDDELTHLRRKFKVARKRRELIEDAQANDKSIYRLRDQIEVFKDLHPDGFVAEAWTSLYRPESPKRRLKRHRNAAIAHAQEALSKDALGALIDDAVYDDILDIATEVAKATDLVPPAAVKLLGKIKEKEKFGLALWGVLYGQEDFVDRFELWLNALPEGGNWQLATVFLALTDPENHVWVSPASFRRQAKWMAPDLSLKNQPSTVAYHRILRMGQSIRDELTNAKLQPRDLIDVSDFIVVTMKPSKIPS